VPGGKAGRGRGFGVGLVFEQLRFLQAIWVCPDSASVMAPPQIRKIVPVIESMILVNSSHKVFGSAES
jgi:hypothetical protein